MPTDPPVAPDERPLVGTPALPADPAIGPGAVLSRRGFLGFGAVVLLGGARAWSASTGALGTRGAASAPGDVAQLYVGTYTSGTESRGIYRLSVDRATGVFQAPTLAADARDPSFLALSRDGRMLVAVNELVEYEGRPAGAVTAFTRDLATGALTPTGTWSSLGGAPCYVSLDRAARHALVANYVGGSVAAFALTGGGATSTSHIVHRGAGPHPIRQRAPHAHCIVLSPDQRFALAADLGIDRVLVYRFDESRGELSASPVTEGVLAAGAGPRHLAFAPDGRTLYVVNELNSTLARFAYDARTGSLRLRQLVETRATGATGANLPADLHVHPSGRAVYVSNRGDDTIAVFGVRAGGTLVPMQVAPSGGHWPRNFALDPQGTLLLVAHQRSHAITSFRVDAATGRLERTGAEVQVPAPVCLCFAG